MSFKRSFLLEDRALYYAPSLSVLREMAKEGNNQRETVSLIAFGNPIIGKDGQRNEELCPLPEAATEATTIAKTFGAAGSKVFIGREASGIYAILRDRFNVKSQTTQAVFTLNLHIET